MTGLKYLKRVTICVLRPDTIAEKHQLGIRNCLCILGVGLYADLGTNVVILKDIC